jgi:hypothetical protein
VSFAGWCTTLMIWSMAAAIRDDWGGRLPRVCDCCVYCHELCVVGCVPIRVVSCRLFARGARACTLPRLVG